MMRWLLVLCGLLALVGCGRRSEVVARETDLNLSGNWNDGDARAVAAGLIPELLSGAWLETFRAEHGRPPVIRVGRLRVRTAALDDEVDTVIVTNAIERALVADGRARIVGRRSEAGTQRSERKDLAAHTTQAPAQVAELAPDLILSGSILTQDDSVLDPGLTGTYRQVKFYQADFALLGAESNEIVWRGSVERKKTITQSTTGW